MDKLLGDRIVVKPDPREEKTVSGIFLANTREEDSRVLSGTVLDVGTGRWIVDGLGSKREDMEVKAGDKVLYPRYAGIPAMAHLDKTTMILNQRDILAIVGE